MDGDVVVDLELESHGYYYQPFDHEAAILAAAEAFRKQIG